MRALCMESLSCEALSGHLFYLLTAKAKQKTKKPKGTFLLT